MLAFSDTLISLVILAAAVLVAPKFASCPRERGWLVNGIRPTGEFSCLHNSQVESDEAADRELRGRLYCERGFIPQVLSDRTIACGWEH